MKTKIICSVVLLMAMAGSISAEETNQNVKAGSEVVITATGWPVPETETPGGTGVVLARDIAIGHPGTVAETLGILPGVKRVADGPWAVDVNIRGMSRDSVVLTIDGARVNTSTDLGGRLAMVAPSDIERIEVLKGPVSSLYGSGSIGGVVNVVTKSGRFSRQKEQIGSVTFAGGANPDGFDASFNHAINGPVQYIFSSASFRDYGSYSDGDGSEISNSQYTDGHFRMAGGYRLNDHHSLEADMQFFRASDVGIPGGGTAPLPAQADVTYDSADRTLIQVVDTVDVEGPHYRQSQVKVYYQVIDRKVVVNNFAPANPVESLYPRGKHETVGGKWINRAEFGAHRVSSGVDAWWRKVESTRERVLKTGQRMQERPIPEADETSTGVFLEDTWSPARGWTLNGGARTDAVVTENEATDRWAAGDETDWVWNMHLGCAKQLSDNLTARALGASGYRVASIEERYQYLQLGGGIIKLGDPELDPERSLFGEVGLDWKGENSAVSLSAFVNRLDDMIGEERVDENTFVSANVEKARIEGVEAEASYKLSGAVECYASLSWLTGRDTDTDEYLPGIAPLNGRAGVRYGGERGFSGGLETVWASSQDKVPDGEKEATGWMIVNLHSSWRFAEGSLLDEVFLRVNNVLDETYRDYLTTYRGNTYNEPGCSVAMGGSVEF